MSPDSRALLEGELRREGLFTPFVHEKLSIYVRELERWNEKVNLTSLQGEELVRRLVVEPVQIGRQLQMSGALADIGSGNGSPGIPLHVCGGLKRVHLIEPRAKRAAFLRHVANLIDRDRIMVHKTRIEDLERMTEPVDWVSMQAVHPSEDLLNALRRLAGTTTRVVWITSVSSPPISTATPLIGKTGTLLAWVFQLDQS